jgi:hypothetical protein
MRRWIAASALLAATLLQLACASRSAPAALGAPYADPSAEVAAARGTVLTFLLAEARGDPSSDTLLLVGADFIATGISVTSRPRLAGVVGRGTAEVVESRTEVAGFLAWTVAVYRWTGGTPPRETRARATFVLERRPAGWRIRHVHSSTIESWEGS